MSDDAAGTPRNRGVHGRPARKPPHTSSAERDDPSADSDEHQAPRSTGEVAVPEGTPVGEVVELAPVADVARAALNRAKAAAQAKGVRPGQPARRRSPLEPPRGSPGKDGRDPRLVGDVFASLLRDRGWVRDVSVGGVIGRWREVVGEDIADHCRPETFENGVLVVRADSTAWAANLKLLASTLLGRLADEVGEGVVTEVKVLGPAGPSFTRGLRSVRGRGPRDTYG